MHYFTEIRRLGWLLIMWAIAVELGACQPTKPEGGASGLSEAEQVANDLAQDINLLETLNRLQLQSAQVETLRQLALQAQQARAQAETVRQAALMQLIPLLREKRALLLRDQEIPKELEKQLRAAQAKLEAAEEEATRAPLSVVPALRQALTEDQIAILTGADEAQAQAEDLLDWIRRLSPGQYAEEGKANARQLAEPELGLTEANILKIFDEVRKLSPADYARKKQDYIKRLAPLYAPTREAADQALAEFIATPRLAQILAERTAQ